MRSGSCIGAGRVPGARFRLVHARSLLAISGRRRADRTHPTVHTKSVDAPIARRAPRWSAASAAELEALEGRIDRSDRAWTTPQSVEWLAAGLSLETDQAVDGPQAFHDRLRLEAGGRGRGNAARCAAPSSVNPKPWSQNH
jgi:hypothetical protein